MAHLPCLTRTRSWVPMIPYMRLLWSNFCIYLFVLLILFSIFSVRLFITCIPYTYNVCRRNPKFSSREVLADSGDRDQTAFFFCSYSITYIVSFTEIICISMLHRLNVFFMIFFMQFNSLHFLFFF